MKDLIGPAAAAGPSGGVHAVAGNVLQVDVGKLDDNPFQPRREMDEGALKELMASIREHGLLQAIIVCRDGDRYQIIAGHRRTTAFRRLRDEAKTDDDRRRFGFILAQERLGVTDQQKAIYALVENLQREDINPLEAAVGLMKLQELGNLKTAKEVSDATGVKEDRVRRLLRLNDSPNVVKDGVSRGLLVTVLEEDGTVAKTGAGKDRREHRHLDLMSALEFSKLHKHILAKNPKKADERTARAIERALRDGWHFRRIQEHVTQVIDGRETFDADERGVGARPAFENSERKLVVHLARVGGMSDRDRTALESVLMNLLEQLQAKDAARAAGPQATLPAPSGVLSPAPSGATSA